MGVIAGVIIGVYIGVTLMCLLQVSRLNKRDVENKQMIDYLHTYLETNSKGKTEYDKGYTDGLEYACALIEEELQ